MQLMDPRRARIGKALAWGGGLAAAGLLAPLIFMSIKGMLGLGLALFLGLMLIHGAPWVAMKAANLGLKAVKHEARLNPIESLQQQAQAARERLDQSRQELQNFNAQRRNFEQEVEQYRKESPDDVAELEQQLEQINALFEHKQKQLAQAEREIEQVEEATSRAARKWKMAQSANRMSALAGGTKTKAMDKIVAEEAFDSVRTSMNQALASMDAAIAQNIKTGSAA